MKLTDSHLVLLSAAAQHADGLLARPDAMPDKAAQALARKLVRAGLAEAVTLNPDQPSWREDDEHRPMGLRITAAGLAALGLEAEEPSTPVGMVAHQPLPGQSPRAGTKQAHIIALLEREEGVSLDDLIAATGWAAPHHTSGAHATAPEWLHPGQEHGRGRPDPVPHPPTAAAA